jgi:hypothetical protein
MFQAHIRGYLIRKAYKKLQDQRLVSKNDWWIVCWI